MRKSIFQLSILALAGLMTGCAPKSVESTQVLLTSEAGAKCDAGQQVTFVKTKAASENAVVVDVNEERQTIDGFGGSLTESSAYVLACISPEQRKEVLNELFGEDGANFSAVRTQLGASDFSVEGKYSYAEKEGDVELASFTLDEDKAGFPKSKYPDVKDENYDLYQLMMEVANIKKNQEDQTYRILLSPWTAPAWMKDNNAYYERDYSVNPPIHRGGKLLPQYYQTFADYFVKYLQAYREDGVEFWALTPENEPMGNDGGWESMDLSPEVEAELIGKYLGPTLEKAGFGDIKIFGFDQNIFEMVPYVDAIYGDSAAKAYTTGMALHWYGSTFSCFPEMLDSIHSVYPDKVLFHTEGCIDNLGCPAWDAVQDKEGFMESGWFNNDSFWWNEEATDWAYSTPYWPELHPKYSGVHRYARYIIEGMNHWMTGFIDWNIVLDSIGGPNHVNNFAASQVMIDYKNDIIYFTPYYYALKQFSRSMRPGDVVLGIQQPASDNLYVCAVKKADGSIAVNMLNTAKEEESFKLRIGDYEADVVAPANSVQTIFVKF